MVGFLVLGLRADFNGGNLVSLASSVHTTPEEATATRVEDPFPGVRYDNLTHFQSGSWNLVLLVLPVCLGLSRTDHVIHLSHLFGLKAPRLRAWWQGIPYPQVVGHLAPAEGIAVVMGVEELESRCQLLLVSHLDSETEVCPLWPRLFRVPLYGSRHLVRLHRYTSLFFLLSLRTRHSQDGTLEVLDLFTGIIRQEVIEVQSFGLWQLGLIPLDELRGIFASGLIVIKGNRIALIGDIEVRLAVRLKPCPLRVHFGLTVMAKATVRHRGLYLADSAFHPAILHRAPPFQVFASESIAGLET